MHLHSILVPKKVVENNKKKLPSYMYDDFHAHLVVTNSNTQESNMHGKLKKWIPFIYTEKTYMLYKDSEFILMRSVKDIESSTS